MRCVFVLLFIVISLIYCVLYFCTLRYVLFSSCLLAVQVVFFFFKQKTAYEMRISDWSSDVCSSDLDSMAQPKYNFHPCRIHHFLRTRPMCSRTFPRVLAAVMLAGASSLALAAGWPEKSVRVIVAYPPGGVSDAVTRAISEKLGERLGASDRKSTGLNSSH